MLEYIILGYLSKCNMSGYEIKQHMSISTAKFFDASFGSIYPALKRLEGKGQITSTEVVEGGKFKKVYTITDAGQAVLLEWLDQPADMSGAKPDHLLKVFFFRKLPIEKVREKVAGMISDARKELESLEQIEKLVEEMADTYEMTTLYYGKAYYQFTIKWYEDYLKKLDSEKE